jgi:hypothetical protein
MRVVCEFNLAVVIESGWRGLMRRVQNYSLDIILETIRPIVID